MGCSLLGALQFDCDVEESNGHADDNKDDDDHDDDIMTTYVDWGRAESAEQKSKTKWLSFSRCASRRLLLIS